ncbi:MAG: uracil-DNA glycosylase [Gemmatimonadota bacterium]
MTIDRNSLLQYLRQRAEYGERELFLENLTAVEAIALLATGSRIADRGSRIADQGSGIRDEVEEKTNDARAVDPQSAIRDPRSAQLVVLQDKASGCIACRLHEARKTVVFGEGNPNADLMVVGEAPGQEEDRTGRPFVGQAGKLLDLLLMTTGFPRESVYICNTLKCRPPNNRNPLADELESCSGFLQGQIDAIAPRALIAVGKFAAQSLLQSEESIGRLRGQIHNYRGKPLIVTYHPAYLLRTPSASRVAWQDFQLLRQVLDEQP